MKEASGLVPAPAKAKPGRPKADPKAAAPKTTAPKAPVKGSLTVADLQAVVEFSKKFGGIDGLSDAVAAIKSLS